MTEYATTPSAIEEWNTIRDRTATWVEKSLPPSICYTPSQPLSEDSDNERRSLWDGGGWEVPSDCESATSIPPTMMLKYADEHQVLITPDRSEAASGIARGNKTRSKRTATATATDREIREDQRTEKAASHAPTAQKGPTTYQASHAGTARPSQAASAVREQKPASAVRSTQPSKRSSARGRAAPSTHTEKELQQPSSAPVSPEEPQPLAPPSPVVPSAPSKRSQGSAQPSRHSTSPTHATSRQPSHSPSNAAPQAPSPPLTHTGGSHPSSRNAPSHVPTQATAPSHHTNDVPPSAFVPPSNPSINSRSMSHSDSRSSGPPEAITIHPPTVAPSMHSSARMPHPPSHVPSHAMTAQSASVVANVALPPSSISSAPLSYVTTPPSMYAHETPQQIEPVYNQPSMRSSGISRRDAAAQTAPLRMSGLSASHSSQHVLPTPVSLNEHFTVRPGRALSNMSTTGLDGGYVLVDAGDTLGDESTPSQKKGSFGSKGGHERGSLLSVFSGASSKFGHSRSRSLGQTMEGAPDGLPPTSSPLDPIPGSPNSYRSHRTHRSHKSQQVQGSAANLYPSPVSPTNPNPFSSRHDGADGPHPPSIVYAPARHGRVSQFSPPRIMYMPASPRGGAEHSPSGSMRRININSPVEGHMGVRDSGWGELNGGSGSVHTHKTIVARDYGPGVDMGSAQVVADANPEANVMFGPNGFPVDPARPTASPSRKTHSSSDAASNQTNLAGVGTHPSNRSRSRSRARGITFSASAPQPSSASAPHAAMMMPPNHEHEKGVRDTPYPTPPGSAAENPTPAAVITAASQGHSYYSSKKHRPVSVRSVPLTNAAYAQAGIPEVPPSEVPTESRLGTTNLMSRFRDIYQHPAPRSHERRPETTYDPAQEDSRRGRGRDRRSRADEMYARQRMREGRRHVPRRDLSADSAGSASSASTYYVISNPGQKVRIIRTDGTTVTQDTSVSRHPSDVRSNRQGWFKKAKAAALRPRFGGAKDRERDVLSPDVSAEPNAAHVPSSGTGNGSGSTEKKKAARRKLLRRNSTGSSALLAMSRQASAGGEPAVYPEKE